MDWIPGLQIGITFFLSAIFFSFQKIGSDSVNHADSDDVKIFVDSLETQVLTVKFWKLSSIIYHKMDCNEYPTIFKCNWISLFRAELKYDVAKKNKLRRFWASEQAKNKNWRILGGRRTHGTLNGMIRHGLRWRSGTKLRMRLRLNDL